MVEMRFHDPRIMRWQARLARVPRWAWIAFFVGAVVPLLVLGAFIIVTALVTGTIVLVAVMVAAGLVGLLWRLASPRRDGRRNVQIVVRSARVIDP